MKMTWTMAGPFVRRPYQVMSGSSERQSSYQRWREVTTEKAEGLLSTSGSGREGCT